ncbi:ParB/RepB/Spo0J family partition protein [Amycolatopsis sp. NPDC023774]|uniref:ParB/RepB/Spo0J family partition protein n=1 Tax=Amycolatopsis sp. NPDC023774 TaxID=3155015 RepID=UPI0033FB007F
MAKRVNLADLAKVDFYDPAKDKNPASAPVQAPAPESGPALVSVPDAAADAPDAGEPESAMRSVPVSRVVANPLNKRQAGFDDEVDGLAATIRARGIIQPLVVCSVEAYLAEFPGEASRVEGFDWVVLIGNRRLEGARRAPLDEVPIIINDESASSMYEVMLIENSQRRALPPLLEAEALSAVMDRRGMSLRELATEIGKSHTYIRQRLVLLDLIPGLRQAFSHGALTIEQARQFGELPEATQQEIVDAGPPYRMPAPKKPVVAMTRRRAIRASSPAIAAASIRSVFSPDELQELIRLLTEEASEPAAEA